MAPPGRYHRIMVTSKRITSAANPTLQLFRTAAAGRDRERVLVEGVRHLADLLAAGHTPDTVLVAADLATRPGGAALGEALAGLPRETLVVEAPNRLVERVTTLETAPGALALLPRPRWQATDLVRSGGVLLLLCGVQDPGNVGTLVRSAHAAGAAGLLTLPGTADPLGPKALRASAGSALRLPAAPVESPAAAVALLERAGVALVGADPAAGTDWRRAGLAPPLALALGPEAGGLPAAVEAALAGRVRIPLAPGVDSLNVAVAGSLLLFEALRPEEEK